MSGSGGESAVEIITEPVADRVGNVVRPATPPSVDNTIIQQNPASSANEMSLQSREEYLTMKAELVQHLTMKAQLGTEIFNIMGFFSVFQGVMIAAVSQLRSDTYSTCKLILWPIILTCLVAIVCIVAFSVKWSYRHEVEKMIHSCNDDLKDARNKLQNLKPDIPNPVLYTDRLLGRFSSIKGILVVLAMLLFSGVFIMAYFAILCDCLVVRKWEGGLSRSTAATPSAL